MWASQYVRQLGHEGRHRFSGWVLAEVLIGYKTATDTNEMQGQGGVVEGLQACTPSAFRGGQQDFVHLVLHITKLPKD